MGGSLAYNPNILNQGKASAFGFHQTIFWSSREQKKLPLLPHRL
jgi:hypothetical protein